MSAPGRLTDAELTVVDARGSRLAVAYAPSWLAAAAELEAAFGFPPEISITNGHPIGAYRTVAEQASLPGAAGAAYSDHTKGRAVDIGNQRRFRNIDEVRFIAILAAHGYFNVGSGGHPFPQEPWHFANQSATPAGAGTLITTPEQENTMLLIYILDSEGRYGVKGKGHYALVTPTGTVPIVRDELATALTWAFGVKNPDGSPSKNAYNLTYDEWELFHQTAAAPAGTLTLELTGTAKPA